MNLTQLIKQMKPDQRQKLQHLLERKQTVEHNQIEPHQLKEGSIIQDPSGSIKFIKTKMGWKSDVQVTSEQIITKLVNPNVAQVVAEDLKRTRQGERYTLLPTSLKVQGIGNEGGKLTFERTERGFVDPTYLSDDQMKSIVEKFTSVS
jgi:hypothetical protein